MTAQPRVIYYLLPLFGIVLLSPDTLMLRLMPFELDGLLAVRGFVNAGFLCIYLLIRYRGEWLRKTLAIGWPGLGAAFFFWLGNLAFIYAARNTAAADLLVILAVLPVASGLLSIWILKESPSKSLWLASVGCCAGMVLLFFGDLNVQAFSGNLGALCAVGSLSIALILLRMRKDQDMTPVYLVAGLMMVASAAPTATIIPLIRLEDWWIYLIYSIAVNAFVLVIIAMRYLPAPEVSLFILLETILGPLWVWIVLAEVPRAETVAGGMLILGVLICYFSYAIYRHRRAIRQSPARTYQH